MENADELPLHAPVRIVCRECLPSNEYLPHVVLRIDEFLDDFPGQKAFSAACKRGESAQSLDYLLGRSVPNWKEAICLAAQGGHLHTLQWMAIKREGRRRPWKKDFREALGAAAAQGHLETVIWLFNNYTAMYPLGALCMAAGNGHLAVVQWLHEHGIKDESSNALGFAAATGQLEVVKWLHQYQDYVYPEAIVQAAEGGHLEVVQWLNQVSSPGIIDAAAGNGHLEVIQWLYAKMKPKWGASFTEKNAYTFAAQNGHLEVMKWVRDHYGTYRPNRLTFANEIASRGHLHILKWVANVDGCYFTSDAMNGAAANGHLDVVQWLHSKEWFHTPNQETCTEEAIDKAAGNGHLAVVQWLHDHRREGCTTKAMDLAAANGQLDVIRWLHENRTQGCSWQAILNAARNDHVEVVRWLYENYEFPITTMMEAAALAASASEGSLKMLQIFGKHDWFSHPKYLTPVMVNAFKKGEVAVVEWLLQLGYQVRPEDCKWAADNLEVMQITYRGAEVSVPDVRRTILQRGNLRMAWWLSCHGCNVNSQLYTEIWHVRVNWSLFRWRIENSLKFDVSAAWNIFSRCARPEVTRWIPESDCVSIVSQALSTEKNLSETLWVLENVDFPLDSSRLAIRSALEHASSDTKLWFKEHLWTVESRAWCFATDDEHESERPSKRVRRN